MNRDEVHAQSRLAGQVRRYHTWMVLHQQSIGEHSWQCMRIWWQIWGPLPPEVTTYFIWHDAGELVAGDLPFPVKAKNPVLKDTMDELEDRAVKAMGGPAGHPPDGYNKIRAKACDLIDMYEYGLHERRLGNQYAEPIITDTYTALRKLSLSSEDQFAVSAYLAKVERLDAERK